MTLLNDFFAELPSGTTDCDTIQRHRSTSPRLRWASCDLRPRDDHSGLPVEDSGGQMAETESEGKELETSDYVQHDFLSRLTTELIAVSFVSSVFFWSLTGPSILVYCVATFGLGQVGIQFCLNKKMVSAFMATQITMSTSFISLSIQCMATGGTKSPFLVVFSVFSYGYIGKMPVKWCKFWTVLTLLTVFCLSCLGQSLAFTKTSLLSDSSSQFFDVFLRLLVIAVGGAESIRFTSWNSSMIRLLRKEKQSAYQASEAKSQFLAVMSHEIRTPLQGVIGWVDLLLNEPTLRHSPDTQSKLSYLSQCSQMLKEVVSNILDFSKIQEGKFTLEILPFSPREVIETMVSSLSVDRSKLAINVSLTGVPSVVIGPYVGVKQCLSNLISNAVKFTNQGSISVSCVARPVAAGSPGKPGDLELTFEVADTGIGIADENQNHLFTAFTQADLSTTRNYGGTGLGLAIIKNLSKLMGGDAWCKSQLGVGSSFFFSTIIQPTKELELASTQVPETVFEHSKHSFDTPLLIVDDNKMNHLFLKSALGKLGIPFIQAWDGLEAINTFKNHQVSMILMDLHMPKMNGYEATTAIRNLKEQGGDTAIIVAVTADAQESTKKKVKDFGFTDFISKPFTFQNLSDLLDRWLPRAKDS